MKIRTDFVTNSSSSSFIINLYIETEKNRYQIAFYRESQGDDSDGYFGTRLDPAKGYDKIVNEFEEGRNTFRGEKVVKIIKEYMIEARGEYLNELDKDVEKMITRFKENAVSIDSKSQELFFDILNNTYCPWCLKEETVFNVYDKKETTIYSLDNEGYFELNAKNLCADFFSDEDEVYEEYDEDDYSEYDDELEDVEKEEYSSDYITFEYVEKFGILDLPVENENTSIKKEKTQEQVIKTNEKENKKVIENETEIIKKVEEPNNNENIEEDIKKIDIFEYDNSDSRVFELEKILNDTIKKYNVTDYFIDKFNEYDFIELDEEEKIKNSEKEQKFKNFISKVKRTKIDEKLKIDKGSLISIAKFKYAIDYGDIIFEANNSNDMEWYQYDHKLFDFCVDFNKTTYFIIEVPFVEIVDFCVEIASFSKLRKRNSEVYCVNTLRESRMITRISIFNMDEDILENPQLFKKYNLLFCIDFIIKKGDSCYVLFHCSVREIENSHILYFANNPIIHLDNLFRYTVQYFENHGYKLWPKDLFMDFSSETISSEDYKELTDKYALRIKDNDFKCVDYSLFDIEKTKLSISNTEICKNVYKYYINKFGKEGIIEKAKEELYKFCNCIFELQETILDYENVDELVQKIISTIFPGRQPNFKIKLGVDSTQDYFDLELLEILLSPKSIFFIVDKNYRKNLLSLFKYLVIFGGHIKDFSIASYTIKLLDLNTFIEDEEVKLSNPELKTIILIEDENAITKERFEKQDILDSVKISKVENKTQEKKYNFLGVNCTSNKQYGNKYETLSESDIEKLLNLDFEVLMNLKKNMEIDSLNYMPYIFDDQNLNLVYFILFKYLCEENIDSDVFISFVDKCIKDGWNIKLYINKFIQLCKICDSKKGMSLIKEYLVAILNID